MLCGSTAEPRTRSSDRFVSTLSEIATSTDSTCSAAVSGSSDPYLKRPDGLGLPYAMRWPSVRAPFTRFVANARTKLIASLRS